MSLLFPSALALSLLAVPVILLYLLRLRRREVKTSSTLLWTQLIKDRAANAPWQKLHRNILLLLQLLILAGLVFALARPVIPSKTRLNGNVIVLLDISASMTATDEAGGASRFEAAVEQTNRLIENLGPNTTISIITAGYNPEVLAASASNSEQVRQALSTISPESGPADWPGTFALAAGLAQSMADPQFVVISDGGMPETLPLLPGSITFIPVGLDGANLAITAHGTRSTGDSTDLLVNVTNFVDSSARATANLYVDEQLYDSRIVDLMPQEIVQITWSLPSDASIVETRLVPDETTIDHLSIDDTAWSVINNRPHRTVFLVSEGNLFIERLFSILPGYEVTRSTSSQAASITGEDAIADLTIFDGVPVPDPLPAGNILIIDPQPSAEQNIGNPSITVSGTFTDTAVTELVDSPLLQNVSWRDVSVAEAHHVIAPELTPLINSTGGPLLLAGEIDGRHVAILPFDLAASDLPLQIAFPVMMANIADWLDPEGVLIGENDPHPGDIVTLIPDSDVKSVVIQSPRGDVWEQPTGEINGSTLNYRTNETGIYTVFYEEDSGELSQAGRFGVNLVNATESSILPKESMLVGSTDITANTVETGVTEFWPALLVMALILMGLEWWITYRRPVKAPRAKLR